MHPGTRGDDLHQLPTSRDDLSRTADERSFRERLSAVQPSTGGDPDEVFSEPEPNVVESTTGFSVRVLGRVGLEYVEGSRTIWMDSEVLAVPRGIAIHAYSAKVWETPEGPDPLTDEERARVAANIERALRACGYEPEMHERFDWNSIAMCPPRQRQAKRERYREEHGD